jgi:protein-tyrosine phosphatase
MGLDIRSHAAMLLTPELVHEVDLIVVMDFLTEARVLALAREARKKIVLLRRFSGQGLFEIADPYDGDSETVRACASILEQSVYGFAQALLLQEK